MAKETRGRLYLDVDLALAKLLELILEVLSSDILGDVTHE